MLLFRTHCTVLALCCLALGLGLGCARLPKPGPLRTQEPVIARGWSFVESEKSFLNQESGVDAVSYSAPVLVSDKLIFGSERFGLTVLSKRNGQVLWKKPLDGSVLAQPYADENRVIVGTETGSLYGFDLPSGRELWHISLGAPVHGSILQAFQRLYVGTEDEAVHSVDPATGKVLWSYRRSAFGGTSVRGGGNPSAIAGKIWIGFSDGTLVSLHPESGAVDSEKQFRDNLKFTDLDARVVGWREGLLVSTYDGKLRYLRKDGTVIWEFAAGGARAPVISEGDVIYFPSSDGTIYALSGNSGRELWRYSLRRGVPTGLALLNRNGRKVLLVAGSEEKVLALDGSSGMVLGQVSLGRGSGSYGAMVLDPQADVFYVLSQSSRVHEFRLNL